MWGVSTVFLVLVIGLVLAADPTTVPPTVPTTAATTAPTIAITIATTKAPKTTPNTTVLPTTVGNATAVPTTVGNATAVPTTVGNATAVPTTVGNATAVPTTVGNATAVPTTVGNATAVPTTVGNATTPIPTNISTTAEPQNTTTTAKPTSKPPTSKPTPPAPKNAGDYSVKDKEGNYCLLAQMNATFFITYEQKVSKNKTKNVQVHVSMPFKDVNTTGSTCDKASPVLNIKWTHYNFELAFEKKGNKSWEVFSIILIVNTVNNTKFINATEKTIIVDVTNTSELAALSAGLTGYYMCAPDHTYPSDKKDATFHLENVKLQPFVKKGSKDENFGEEHNCEPTPTPNKPEDNNIVPIAVGCALAGLVLIVLIAYIIGRRKSQRGYEKV